MLKTILAASLAIAVNSAQADTATCQKDFTLFKTTATNMLPPNLRSNLEHTTIKIGPIEKEFEYTAKQMSIGGVVVQRMLKNPDSHWLDGKAVYEDDTVYVSCNEDDETNRAVIAHELGHFIANAQALPNSEDQANIFAAEIFFQSATDSKPYLAIIDQLCKNGKEYFCHRAAAWRIGLLGG